MEVVICAIRNADDMTITNTQLAAALVVLGHNVLPSTDFQSKEVTFEFDDDIEIEKYSQAWRMLFSGMKPDDSPLAKMFLVAKARQWVLDRVIHGNHNEGMELPSATMKTSDLEFVICLIASGHYLLKLDKQDRAFHFAAEIEPERDSYERPEPESSYYYGRLYLRTLSDLVRRITGRNLTRQQNPTAITSTR